MKKILASCTLALAGCTPTYDIEVDLRSDYRPGVEVSAAEIALGDERIRSALDVTANLTAGQRIARFSSVVGGSIEVTMRLFDPDGALILQRPTLVEVDRDRVITLVATRDCQNVTCTDRGTSCLGAICVDQACLTGEEDVCPPGCTHDDDCGTTTSECTVARCFDGVCLDFAFDELCPQGATCLPTSGCTASCEDGVANGDEEGIDCGGSCEAPCSCERPFVGETSGAWLRLAEAGGARDDERRCPVNTLLTGMEVRLDNTSVDPDIGRGGIGALIGFRATCRSVSGSTGELASYGESNIEGDLTTGNGTFSLARIDCPADHYAIGYQAYAGAYYVESTDLLTFDRLELICSAIRIGENALVPEGAPTYSGPSPEGEAIGNQFQMRICPAGEFPLVLQTTGGEHSDNLDAECGSAITTFSTCPLE